MIGTPDTITIPLRTDKNGVIRIGNTRVTLSVIIAAYRRGDRPEEIAEGFPTLRLADIYAIIAYYLDHRDEVDQYIRQQQAEAEKIHREIETNRPDMLQSQAKFRALLEEKKRNFHPNIVP